MRWRVAVLDATSLLLGFGVAQVTGNRFAGGIILLVGGVWCAIVLVRHAGPLRTVIVGVVYIGAFIVSHPLGKLIGPWPSVVVVALITGAVAYALAPKAASRN